jgi:ABC-type polysaccharide/polyol phosphate export permease
MRIISEGGDYEAVLGRPSKRSHKLFNALQQLVARRDLLYLITWREIKIRYKQSVMGFLWAILLPAVIVTAGIAVRYGMSAISDKPIHGQEIAGVTVKALLWAFFAGGLRFSSTSLIGNSSLVTKIYMPREIFPLSSILSQLVDLGVASSLVTLIFVVLRLGGSWQLLWVPILLLIAVVLATGCAFLVSAACLFFRDVKYLVEVVITFAVFVTPVFYNVGMFRRWKNLLLLNPLAPILEGLETCIVYRTMPDLSWTAYSAAFALVSLVTGFYFFKRWEPAFAERI